MKYQPHDYQKYATQFIIDHPTAAVFLQMGLGKSVITLTAIQELALERFEVNRVLVIAPLRVARDTWPDEIQKWDHLHGLTCSVAVGTEAERRAALRQNTLIHIINRENVQWLVEQSGLPFDYDMIVIDELSSFKSYQAKRFQALMKMRPKVKRIVGLTGTPSSNGLMDLWAEFRLLDMGKRLGRFITKYREVFFVPDRRNAQQIFSWKPRPGAEDEIYELISDITISMKSVDFLQMPECISNRVPVRLSRSERDTYDELKRELVTSLRGEQIDAVNAASLSNKLCQMANGGIYVDRPSTADAVAGYSPCGTSSTCPRGLVGAEAPPPSAGHCSSTNGSWTPWRTSSKPPTGTRCWWRTGSSTTLPGFESAFLCGRSGRARTLPTGMPEESLWPASTRLLPGTDSTCRPVATRWCGLG